MRVIPALLFVLPLLAGCAMFENDDDYNNINKLVGQSDSLLVKVLGQPTKRYDQDGHRFFAYDVHQLDTFAGYDVLQPYGRYGTLGYRRLGFEAKPDLYEKQCETTFQIDAHRVVGYQRRGNTCDG